jgi:dephospho-CoA kinase
MKLHEVGIELYLSIVDCVCFLLRLETVNDHQNSFVIGLTGSVGSGCTTLSKGLEDKGFRRISVSDLIKDRFRKVHGGKEPDLKSFGEDWRAELQDIGNRGRNGEYVCQPKFGEDHRDYWVKLALKGVADENVVIDGIRNIGEVEWLRKYYAQFWLVAVYVDYKTQWKRIKDLGTYPNEDVFKRDNNRDSGEDERCGQKVQHCVYEADYALRNDKDIQPARCIEGMLADKLMQDIPAMRGHKDFRRDPLPLEVFMATAVSQSHASNCLKRKVGALIVDDENKIPLSVGYNDNPLGMESCFSLFNGQCYKDMVMETKSLSE